ncbi:MAG: hypothetical protein AB7G21_09040, partial [Dehalococcoidia bacterium]
MQRRWVDGSGQSALDGGSRRQADQSSSEERRSWPLNLYASAVGKKWVMAVTGIIGMGFITMHMLGNLKIYL